jgi:hypothetical protein
MPSGEPVSEQVLAALETVLDAILTPTYYTKVRKVVRFEEDALRSVATPMIAVVPEGSSYDDQSAQNVGEFSDDMDIRLLLILNNASDSAKKLLRFERDAKTALLADVTLGGIAIKTSILSASHTLPDERQSLAYTELRIRVRYRTSRGDLNTST